MVRADKRVIVVNEFDHNIIANGMNEYKNMLIEKEMPTEDVDRVLYVILDAPTKRELRRAEREAR